MVDYFEKDITLGDIEVIYEIVSDDDTKWKDKDWFNTEKFS